MFKSSIEIPMPSRNVVFRLGELLLQTVKHVCHLAQITLVALVGHNGFQCPQQLRKPLVGVLSYFCAIQTLIMSTNVSKSRKSMQGVHQFTLTNHILSERARKHNTSFSLYTLLLKVKER